jgi:hypothetical protein
MRGFTGRIFAGLCVKQAMSSLKSMLSPPPGAELFKSDLATYWFYNSNILFSITRPSPRTLASQENNIELVKRITNGKKICLLCDLTSILPPDKHNRDYLSREIPQVFNAIAFVSGSPLGKMVANILISLRINQVPAQLFSSVEVAKNWLIDQTGASS